MLPWVRSTGFLPARLLTQSGIQIHEKFASTSPDKVVGSALHCFQHLGEKQTWVRLKGQFISAPPDTIEGSANQGVDIVIHAAEPQLSNDLIGHKVIGL